MLEVKLHEVSLELSNRCEGRCIHCSSDSKSEADRNDELSSDSWILVIKEAKNLGADVISLSGGEPLIYSDWQEIVWTIANEGMGVLFYTCGIKEAIQPRNHQRPPSILRGISDDDLRCLNNQFSKTWGRIIFSVEGSHQATHDYIVGVRGSFANTIMASKRAKMLGMTVEWHFTPQQANWYQIWDFLTMAQKMGIDKVSFLRLVPQGRAKRNEDIVMYPPRIFHRIQQNLYEWPHDTPKFRIGCPLSFGHLYGYIEERPRCHAGKDLLLIRPNGDVHACAGWKECKDMVLGTVLGSTLWEIWESGAIIDMIRTYHHQDAAEGACKRCTWKYCCGGGCPAQRIIHNQGYEIEGTYARLARGVDPMCPKYRGFLTNEEIKTNRQDGQVHRRQDGEGNVTM